MKLNFEIVEQVGQGSYPDVLHFANTKAQLFSVLDGRLKGKSTNPIDFGEWQDATFEGLMDISPDNGIQNFELKIMPGWGAVGSYRAGNSHKMLIYEFNEHDYRNNVDYKEKIEVRSDTNSTLFYLTPIIGNVKDCYISTRLNGESSLEFSMPFASSEINQLTYENVLYAGWKAYILRKDNAFEEIRDENNKLWIKVSAVERFYELEYSFIEPSISNDPSAKPPADLAVIIVGGGTNLSGGRYATGTAAHALHAILEGSGWKLGVCDVDGIRDLEAEKSHRLDLIKMVQNIWGGYLVWDSVNKIVHLRDPHKWQPYDGFQIRYKKNLKYISRTQSNRIVTKLYPFGHDDLDIALVNGGIKYITNNSYTDKEYVGTYKNQDIYYQDELLEKATAELELNCRPRYLYKIRLLDLNILPDFSHEFFFLGEMVDIIDPDIAPDSPRPRLIWHKYNLFRPWECEFDVGDPQERLIESLKASFGTTGFIDSKFNGNGDMSGNYLEDLTVVTDKIGNLAITNAKIDNLAVSTAKIQDLAVGTAKIDNAAITTAKIENLAVTNAKIESLVADKITAGTITATIEMTSATITGGLIRTAASPYRRIELTTDGLTSYSSGAVKHGFSLDSYGALNLYNANTLVGTMEYDTNGAGTTEESKNRMFIVTYGGYAMKLQSSGNMSIDAPNIYISGDVRLPNSSSRGYVYVGNRTLERYIEDIAYDVAWDLVHDYL